MHGRVAALRGVLTASILGPPRASCLARSEAAHLLVPQDMPGQELGVHASIQVPVEGCNQKRGLPAAAKTPSCVERSDRGDAYATSWKALLPGLQNPPLSEEASSSASSLTGAHTTHS